MTLLYVDSFDHYTGGIQDGSQSGNANKKWDQCVGSATSNCSGLIHGTGPRTGPNCVRFRNQSSAFNTHVYWIKQLPALEDTYYFGAAVYLEQYPTADCNLFHLVKSGVGGQSAVGVHADGTLYVSNPTVLGSSTYVLPLNAWVYVEATITIGNSGSYEVRASEVNVLSGTGDTQLQASGQADQIWIGSYVDNRSIYRMDDFYVCDTNGSVNNGFLGDTAVTALFPTGAGTTTQWTPSTGSNYACVDETSPNDDTDYVSEATAGDIDTYAMQDCSSGTGTVRGVQWCGFVRKDDAGSRTVRPVYRISGTDYEGSDITVLDTYDWTPQVSETSPATSSAWTVSEINAMEAGVKLQA